MMDNGKQCRAASGAWVTFACLTSIHQGHDPRMSQSRKCEEAERERLIAEVAALSTTNAGLVDRVKRLEDGGALALGYCSKGDFESADEVWTKAKGQP